MQVDDCFFSPPFSARLLDWLFGTDPEEMQLGFSMQFFPGQHGEATVEWTYKGKPALLFRPDNARHPFETSLRLQGLGFTSSACLPAPGGVTRPGKCLGFRGLDVLRLLSARLLSVVPSPGRQSRSLCTTATCSAA